MSWEEMWVKTKACSCGNGTVTCSMEMDDWNRISHFETINCPTCKTEAERKERRERALRRKRETLLSRARQLAKRRYLGRWLDQFSGKAKKDSWFLLTGGRGYPSLQTFYKHVREEGIERYLTGHFEHNFAAELQRMRIIDDEIIWST